MKRRFKAVLPELLAMALVLNEDLDRIEGEPTHDDPVACIANWGYEQLSAKLEQFDHLIVRDMHDSAYKQIQQTLHLAERRLHGSVQPAP